VSTSRVARMQPAPQPADCAMPCSRAESGVVAPLFPGFRLRSIRATVLAAQTVTTPAGEVIRFEVDGERKHRLLNGLDDIALTLQYTEQIKAYEARRKAEAAWLFQ